MKLSELETLEQEYAARGWRVEFTTDDGTPEHLTKDDGTGWETWEEAAAMLERLKRVRPLPRYGRGGAFRVVGPDGQEARPVAPPEPVEPEPTPPEPQSERPVLEAIPAGGPLTVLTSNDTAALVGDAEGQVYCCPRAALEGRDQVRWRPKMTTFDSLILSAPSGRGSEQVAHFQDVRSADAALQVRVAYHRPGPGEPGLWLVRRAA